MAWVSSNYVTGFTYRWDQFRAPVAGRYRVRFSGYTLWVPPGGIQMSFKGEQDKVGKPRPPNKNVGDYDRPQPGRTDEPITVYTRNGTMNRRVGEFDLTPTPAVYDIGDVWLLAQRNPGARRVAFLPIASDQLPQSAHAGRRCPERCVPLDGGRRPALR